MSEHPGQPMPPEVQAELHRQQAENLQRLSQQTAEITAQHVERQAEDLEQSYIQSLHENGDVFPTDHPLHSAYTESLVDEVDSSPANEDIETSSKEIAKIEDQLQNPYLRSEEKEKLQAELKSWQEMRKHFEGEQQETVEIFRDLLSAEAQTKAQKEVDERLNESWIDEDASSSPKPPTEPKPAEPTPEPEPEPTPEPEPKPEPTPEPEPPKDLLINDEERADFARWRGRDPAKTEEENKVAYLRYLAGQAAKEVFSAFESSGKIDEGALAKEYDLKLRVAAAEGWDDKAVDVLIHNRPRTDRKSRSPEEWTELKKAEEPLQGMINEALHARFERGPNNAIYKKYLSDALSFLTAIRVAEAHEAKTRGNTAAVETIKDSLLGKEVDGKKVPGILDARAAHDNWSAEEAEEHRQRTLKSIDEGFPEGFVLSAERIQDHLEQLSKWAKKTDKDYRPRHALFPRLKAR